MNKKKMVPLYLGEGPDRRKLGMAEVETLSNGTMFVKAQMLGWREAGEDYGFTYPSFRGVLPPPSASKDEE